MKLSHSFKNSYRHFLITALFAGASAHAATWTWTGLGTDDNWSTAANWSDGVTTGTPATGDTLIFSGTTQLTSNNDLAAGTSFAGIQFAADAGKFELGGNSIALTGNVVSNVGVLQTINFDIDLGSTAERHFTQNVAGETTPFLTINGVLSGSAGVFKDGVGGILTLTGANTYTGRTAINAASQSIATTSIANGGSASGLGASTSVYTNLYIGAGTISYTGGAASTDRLLTMGTSGGSFESSGTGAVHFTNTGDITPAGGGSRTFKFGGDYTGGINIVDSRIVTTTGTVHIAKNGAGTWEFTNDNTYNGVTTVNQGTLIVSGTINSSSAITVNATGSLVYNNSETALTPAVTLNGADLASRAILGGSGTIGSAVVLNNIGDTLSPGSGNGPGVLTFNTAQTWDSFSYDWKLNNFNSVTGVAGTNFDQIDITGTLTLSGSYQLNLLSLTAGNVAGFVGHFNNTSQSWIILTATTGISGFDANNWTLNTDGFTSSPDYNGTFTLDQVGNNLVLQYTAVPEPSAYALFMGAGLLLLVMRRVRRIA